MNLKKVQALRRRIEELRRQKGVQSREVESLARTLGRKRSRRGHEPTWVNEVLPGRRPLSIPHHSKELKIGTKNNILDALEADLDGYEEIIIENEKKNGRA